MADDMVLERHETDAEEAVLRIYEIGYHVTPQVKETEVEKIVGEVRTVIEKEGGSFIAEGTPALMRLAYPMSVVEKEKRLEHDRAYFGWIKFEAHVAVAQTLDTVLKNNPNLLRHMIFQTVREDTRAKMKAPTLREVKRTDVIKPQRRVEESSAAPLSEAELEKAIQDITTE